MATNRTPSRGPIPRDVGLPRTVPKPSPTTPTTTNSNDIMQVVADLWFKYVQIPLYQIGLGNPNIRFIVVTCATAGLIWYLRPKAFFFEKTSQPRPSRIKDPSDPNAVVLDWILFSIFMGSISVLFI